jgi:hypothetical protein
MLLECLDVLTQTDQDKTALEQLHGCNAKVQQDGECTAVFLGYKSSTMLTPLP